MVKLAKQSSKNVSSSQTDRTKTWRRAQYWATTHDQGDAQALVRSVQHVDGRMTLRKCVEIKPGECNNRNPKSDRGQFLKCNKTVIVQTENKRW